MRMGDGDNLVHELIAELKAVHAELRAMRAGPQRATTGKTVAELFELYEATWSEQSWARSMRATLKSGLRWFGAKIADQVTRADWLHWRDHVRAKETTIRRDADRNPKTPAVYTRNLELKRWRQAYKWGLEEGHVAANPLAGIKAARGGKKHRETEPTEQDVQAERRHCDDLTWAFILLGYRRGFRASEARRLEWRQVDLQRGTITLYAWQEKTRRAQVLRVTSDAVAALKAIKPDVPGRYVFPGRDGGPMHATTMWRRVRMAIDAANLQAAEGDHRVTFHDHRHGFTSRAARRVPLQVAMRLSRHRSLSAAQRYLHVNDEDLEAAYEKLEEDTRSQKVNRYRCVLHMCPQPT